MCIVHTHLDFNWYGLLKNIVVVSWYGEITLKILKEKPIKSIKIIAHLDIQLCIHTLGIKVLTIEKKSFQKDFWKQDLILILQKLITTIWLKFHKKKNHI